jgi:hypothetical protein
MVTLDPDHRLPDMDTENNSLSGVPIAKGVTAASVIKNYLDAIGGADKVRAIKDMTINASGPLQGTTVQLVNRFKSPDKFDYNVIAPAYNYVLLHLKGIGDSVSIVQQNQPINNTTKEYQRHLVDRFAFFPELDYSKDGYVITLDNRLYAVNDNLAYLVITTHPDGTKVKSYFDQQTGLKLKQVTDVANATPTEFADYHEVNGVKIPYDIKTVMLGVPVEYKVTTAVANTGLSDELFK